MTEELKRPKMCPKRVWRRLSDRERQFIVDHARLHGRWLEDRVVDKIISWPTPLTWRGAAEIALAGAAAPMADMTDLPSVGEVYAKMRERMPLCYDEEVNGSDVETQRVVASYLDLYSGEKA